ncbi:MAG: hypothetical protein WD894_07780 [Pirellulales bacterium]
MANASETSEVGAPGPVVPWPGQASAVYPACGPRSLLQDPFLPAVAKLCEEMFGGEVTVEPMLDPSEPTESWLCFNVSAEGSHADILKRELQWHEEIERLTGDRTGKYRLSIYPVA